MLRGTVTRQLGHVRLVKTVGWWRRLVKGFSTRLSRSRHKYTLQRAYLTSHAFSFCWFTPITALPVHTHSLVFTHYGCCSFHCRRRGCRYIALFSVFFPALFAEFVCLTRGFDSAKDLDWSWKFFAIFLFLFLTLVLAFASKDFSLARMEEYFQIYSCNKTKRFCGFIHESFFFRGVYMTSSSSLRNVDHFVTHHNRLARRLWFRQTGRQIFFFFFFFSFFLFFFVNETRQTWRLSQLFHFCY